MLTCVQNKDNVSTVFLNFMFPFLKQFIECRYIRCRRSELVSITILRTRIFTLSNMYPSACIKRPVLHAFLLSGKDPHSLKFFADPRQPPFPSLPLSTVFSIYNRGTNLIHFPLETASPCEYGKTGFTTHNKKTSKNTGRKRSLLDFERIKPKQLSKIN